LENGGLWAPAGCSTGTKALVARRRRTKKRRTHPNASLPTHAKGGPRGWDEFAGDAGLKKMAEASALLLGEF
jgi:hypothetical protein